MKNEKTAFAERLQAALKAADIQASPAVLVKLLARHGGSNVAPQTVSGWLHGKFMPKQGNMRALAMIVGVPPHVLEYGERLHKGVREATVSWPSHVRGQDRLAIEEYLSLPANQRELIRELIAELARGTTERKR